MKLILYIFLTVTLWFTPKDQPTDDWYLLADVKIETRRDDLLMEDRDFPVFGKNLLEKDGKEIELAGYMVPLDELLGQKNFVISSLPFQTCFFCGGAGPETVAEVRTTDAIKFTDSKIRVKGRLVLNDSDPVRLYYTLVDAEIID